MQIGEETMVSRDPWKLLTEENAFENTLPAQIIWF